MLTFCRSAIHCGNFCAPGCFDALDRMLSDGVVLARRAPFGHCHTVRFGYSDHGACELAFESSQVVQRALQIADKFEPAVWL